MRPVQNLQLGGRNSKSRYQFILQSVGFEGVNEWADKMAQKMRADPAFGSVADGLIFPQFVTLIITPVIYLYLDSMPVTAQWKFRHPF